MTTTLPSRYREDLKLLYQCPDSLFTEGGSFLRIVESLQGQAYLAVYDTFSVLSVSPKESKRIRKIFDDTHNYAEADLKVFWKNVKLEEQHLGRILDKEMIPDFKLPEEYRLKRHDPADHPLLKAFLEQCSPEDIDDALIDLEDPDDAIVLVMQGETPVAYAGYRIWQKNMGDVGILVLPEHRRKGVGVAAVAETTRVCRERGYVPLYRHCTTNLGSGSIAQAIGYRTVWTVNAYSVSD